MPSPLSIVLAYNPASGRFRPGALARLRDALVLAGHRVRCENSRSLRLDVGERVDLVCAYGGDGTVRTVVGENGDGASQAKFCVFPAGTINLIAREAGYPASPSDFARMIAQREAARPHRYGHIGREAFLCCASVGPDAAVVARVSERLKARIGRLAYGVAALAQWRHWPRQMFAFTVDGQSYTGEAMFICKGRYYAGPWVIDEAARLESDAFRVLIMPRARRRDFLQLALSAIIHPALGSATWQRLSAHTITVDSERPAPIQADGDIVAQTPATISLSPSYLNFL